MRPIRMHRQICAYIDVLGGAELFRGKDRKKAEIFFECLEDFEQRMNGWSRHLPNKRHASVLVKTFSDNIFLAFPLRANPTISSVAVVDIFLIELVEQLRKLFLAGFAVRGAVTIGSLMFTERFLFGPALVEAVNLEKEAFFPRVLLSESVLKYISLTKASSNLVLRDVNGKAFLHYLGNAGTLFLMRLHKEYVQKGLEENASKIYVRQKYEWLARYHNFVANYSEKNEFAIPIDSTEMFSALPNSLLYTTIEKLPLNPILLAALPQTNRVRRKNSQN